MQHRLKNANDVGGHGIGDDILVTVSRTLVEHLRQPELVARLGGDEFAVVCPGMTAKDGESIAARLVGAVAALRFESAAQTLQVGCSVGIASYPADAQTGDELIGCADFAMYEAKHNGKNGWAAYHHDPLRTKAESARLDWNARIHRALQFGHFVGVVQIRIIRETWNPSVGAALAAFGATHKSPVLNLALPSHRLSDHVADPLHPRGRPNVRQRPRRRQANKPVHAPTPPASTIQLLHQPPPKRANLTMQLPEAFDSLLD